MIEEIFTLHHDYYCDIGVHPNMLCLTEKMVQIIKDELSPLVIRRYIDIDKDTLLGMTIMLTQEKLTKPLVFYSPVGVKFDL